MRGNPYDLVSNLVMSWHFYASTASCPTNIIGLVSLRLIEFIFSYSYGHSAIISGG